MAATPRTKKRGFPKGKTHADIHRSPFGERLYKTRKARGISQTELGKRVGLSQRMVSHYEGDPPEGPPLSTLTRIAGALNVTVSYLLGESTLKIIKNDISPNLRDHVKTLEQLSPKDRKKVLEYAELLAKANGHDKP
ncbi:MAG: helix-turn-helix domain-containing protein [Chitinivibrionales bacterium]|jgi:transcriptional regulator with XRE-family HTH domain|nr:helix-turn-helix domain-containing protein [Chitinivibrionales bacterium]